MFDVYNDVTSGLKRIAVPVGGALPPGISGQWRKLGTVPHLPNDGEAQVAANGYYTYVYKIEITESIRVP